jgi:hypothetical protein
MVICYLKNIGPASIPPPAIKRTRNTRTARINAEEWGYLSAFFCVVRLNPESGPPVDAAQISPISNFGRTGSLDSRYFGEKLPMQM